MQVYFTRDGWDDYQHWIASDHAVLERVNALIEDARRNRYTGIGKPEPLRGDLSGWWSRRIMGEHRLVYRVSYEGEAQLLVVMQCRRHY